MRMLRINILVIFFYAHEIWWLHWTTDSHSPWTVIHHIWQTSCSTFVLQMKFVCIAHLRVCARVFFSLVPSLSNIDFIYLSLPLVVFRYSNNFQEIPFSRLHVAKSSIQRLLIFAFFLSFYVVSFIQVFRIHICNSFANYEQYDYYYRKSLLWSETKRIEWYENQSTAEFCRSRKMINNTLSDKSCSWRLRMRFSNIFRIKHIYSISRLPTKQLTMSSYDWFFCLFFGILSLLLFNP